MGDAEGDGNDDGRFSLYILKSNPQALASAEAFLKNRGCHVESGTQLRHALAYIMQKQPEYVMITCDHQNKKVRLLPKLLTQALSAKVIVFAENHSGSSAAALAEMQVGHSLYPPVSGPAIDRLVRKIKLDSERKGASDQTVKASGQGAMSTKDENGHLSLKGDRGEDSARTDVKSSFDLARAALSQLISQDSESPDVTAGEATFVDGVANSAAYVPKEQTRYQRGLAYLPPEMQKQGSESVEQWADRVKHTAIQSYSSSGNQRGLAYLPPEMQKQGSESVEQWADRLKQAAVQSYGSDQDSNLAGAPSAETISKPKLPKYRRGAPKPPLDDPNQSIIVRGAQQAMDESVITVAEGTAGDQVEQTANVSCISVKSSRFSGYIVCALGKNKKIDNGLMAAIQSRLILFLKRNGEEIENEDLLELKLQEVDFEDWSLQQADFLRKSIHQGDEIAIAFFPATNNKNLLEDSVSPTMLKVKLEEIVADTKLEFDLYVHMPGNNRYILYVGQGQIFRYEQKERLMAKGVQHMHLKKDSVHHLRKYQAQNFLNAKIEQYRNQTSL